VTRFSNRLIAETSPYLLQHAHNPVDWYPWSEEALSRAKEENKPILVSIGYAACHWCHVMEKESFEDEATAQLMNSHFVCIKVDREERPDLDHFFMDALQSISGGGGWPLNMFLTQEAKPFYGGTYFPPEPIPNRVSWKQLLVRIHEAFHKRREEIEEQANGIIEHLTHSNRLNEKLKQRFELPQEDLFKKEQLETVLNNLLSVADTQYGGFGNAPKFPQTFSIQYLLRYHHYHQSQVALDQAELSLQKMMYGGIYDQLGGGFCRYSTDNEWLAPHFEKMTYDNALLILVFTEAYQITRNNEYKRVVEETISFMTREMRGKNGGFYAALDADSEGVEGKFYTWQKKEFEEIVGSQDFNELFDITETGNWEHVNIPRMKMTIGAWIKSRGLTEKEAFEKVSIVKSKLLKARSRKVRPQTDDKILLGWNALFNQALTRAGLAMGNQEWIDLAVTNMDFLLGAFEDNTKEIWLHTHKEGISKFPAFLDDLANLIQALVYLYEAEPRTWYLDKAKKVLQFVIDHYSDEEGVYFLFSPDFHQEVPVRKLDLYDGATPSGNAIMAWNLYRMSILFNEPEWKIRAIRMLEGTREALVRWPNSFGNWANLLLEVMESSYEIVVLGPEAAARGKSLLKNFIPNRVFMSASAPDPVYPLMQGRPDNAVNQYFLCSNYACELPFFTEFELLEAILTKR
jgi:uncharacterized protein YyaL (SSP411 family)